MASNYSFYSIPTYWFLALVPHAYAVAVAKKANKGFWDNTNPRRTGYLEKNIPKDVFAKYERAEAAHTNGMENAPYFIGAVLAGNFAGLDASTMNIYTGVYIGLRALYNILYVNTTTLKNSRARSLVWIAGLLTIFTLYIKAANKVLADS
ncbi:hypothetical protein EKO04_002997 [Ascochyta lentis]|uniref:Membrane-associated, eicosanoid/glutathione metabolism (MAPEG) protein n=1 Tax=Ascochyta lentis TaxID=205686 RepID=A0A8H7ML62_9PLEO|nr:hypothetical protein EKO04_002997 [Ascochyta lentis]